MKKNDYFLDVSGYQPADLTAVCAAAGTRNTIIKVSEYITYLNPNRHQQVSTSNCIGFYHFARFGGNVAQAQQEADYFISNLPSRNVPYLVCDYEDDASGDVNANTEAVLAFMRKCKQAGFEPIYYSYKPYTLANVEYHRILAEFPNSLWIAAYPDYNVTPAPVWEVFPSMDGIRWWQFTSTGIAGGLDKNIVLLDDNASAPTPQPQANNKLKVYQVNDLQFVNGIWQVKCDDLCPVEFDWTQNGIACEDIDITDANGNVIDDQVTKVGSYFVINPNKIVSDGEGAYGSGGYYWRHITLAASGQIWLSVWDINHLLYG